MLQSIAGKVLDPSLQQAGQSIARTLIGRQAAPSHFSENYYVGIEEGMQETKERIRNRQIGFFETVSPVTIFVAALSGIAVSIFIDKVIRKK